MSQNPLTFEELSRGVAKKTGIGASETREVIRLINDAVVRQLKERRAVKIRLFGTFYVLNKKSHSITEIRSGKRRLLLERKKIKFKSGEHFRGKLAHLPRLDEKKVAPLPIAHGAKSSGEKVKIRIDQERVKAIQFQPLRIPRPINPESIRARLKQRLANIRPVENIRPSGASLPTLLNLNMSSSGKFFASLIRHSRLRRQNAIFFTLCSSEKIEIYSGRPRSKQVTVPRNLVLDFLENYLDLTELDIPQERFAKIKTSDKVKGELWLKVYTLPTSHGASVFLKFLLKREGS